MNVVRKRASCPKTNEAVIIQDNSKNRGKLGFEADLIVGKDGVVRRAKVQTLKKALLSSRTMQRKIKTFPCEKAFVH